MRNDILIPLKDTRKMEIQIEENLRYISNIILCSGKYSPEVDLELVNLCKIIEESLQKVTKISNVCVLRPLDESKH